MKQGLGLVGQSLPAHLSWATPAGGGELLNLRHRHRVTVVSSMPGGEGTE